MTDNDASGNGGWAAPGAPVPPPSQGAPMSPTPGSARPPVASSAGIPRQPALTYRSWQPGIVALRPLPFGDFITVPFKAMRFNRAVMVGGPLLLFTASALLTGLALWVAFNDSRLDLLSWNDSYRGVSVSTVVAAAIALLSWVVSDVLASSIVYPGVARAMLGERISLAAALRTLVPRIGHLLLLALAAFVPLAIAGGLVVAVSMTIAASDTGTFGATVLAVVVLVVLVVVPVGVLVAVYSVVARGAVILEKASVIRAIRRAIQLVPGRLWWSVLIMLVVGLIVAALQQAFAFVTQIVAIVPLGLVSTDEASAAIAIGFFVAYLVQMVAVSVTQYSFFGSTSALIYLDVRMRKEGLAFDLANAAEARHAARQNLVA